MVNSGRISQNNNYKQQKMLTEDLKGYSGKKKVIEILSSYEIKAVRMIQQLYHLKRINGWSSEESVFQYLYSVDQKMHKYFMDFTIEIDDKVIFIEVKPKTKLYPPRKKKDFTSEKQKINHQNQLMDYIKNQDKWTAVREWCKAENAKLGFNKYSFQIWTEQELSI